MRQYPHGKLSIDDMGALQIKASIIKNRLVIQFDKSTTWVGFDKVGALQFAEAIKKLAESLEFVQ
jgi:hypothetical protein